MTLEGFVNLVRQCRTLYCLGAISEQASHSYTAWIVHLELRTTCRSEQIQFGSFRCLEEGVSNIRTSHAILAIYAM